jgi:hypothetical protein
MLSRQLAVSQGWNQHHILQTERSTEDPKRWSLRHPELGKNLQNLLEACGTCIDLRRLGVSLFLLIGLEEADLPLTRSLGLRASGERLCEKREGFPCAVPARTQLHTKRQKPFQLHQRKEATLTQSHKCRKPVSLVAWEFV